MSQDKIKIASDLLRLCSTLVQHFPQFIQPEKVIPKLSPQEEKLTQEEPNANCVYEAWVEDQRLRITSTGLNAELVEQILFHLKQRSLSQLTLPAWHTALEKEIAALVETSGPICLHKTKPMVVMALGKKGSGKTTTLLKIALQYRNELDKTVGLIACGGNPDEMYTAGQLTQMADIPFATAETPIKLQRLMAAWQGLDLIFLEMQEEISKDGLELWQNALLESCWLSDAEIHWIARASTPVVEVKEALKKIVNLFPGHLILTHLDVTDVPVHLIHLYQSTKLPISYLGIGEDLLTDLKIADSHEIARDILKQSLKPALNH